MIHEMNDLSSLHDMALFVEVSRTANFSRASGNLGMPAATLSRRIAAMERRLGVRLFNRTTRKVELTDAGRRYFDRCGELVDQARLAQEALRNVADSPTGHVRVSMPVDMGVNHVGPLLPEFARRHPGITIEFDLSPSHRDLVGEQVDVAIRIGAVKGDLLIVRRIGDVEMLMFASPSYLERHGEPQQPADLVEHECLFLPARDALLYGACTATEVQWKFRYVVGSRPTTRGSCACWPSVDWVSSRSRTHWRERR